MSEENKEFEVPEGEADANGDSLDHFDSKALEVARSAFNQGKEMETAIPEVQEKGNVSKEEAERIVRYLFGKNSEMKVDAEDKRALKKKLLDAVNERYDLFPDDHDDAFAVKKGKSRAVPIDSRDFRHALKLIASKDLGEIASDDQISPTIDLCCALASEQKRRTVHRRYAYLDGKLFIDRGDDGENVIFITEEGIQTSDNPPPFLRPKGMVAIPEPGVEGNIDLLKKHINYRSEEEFWLICSWLLASMRPDIPCPILVLQGEQGTGKSTVTKVLRSLVDPRDQLISSAPRSMEDVYANARAWRVVCYDNNSTISSRIADDLCGLSTGTGISQRKLHTNFEEAGFQAKRALIVNGIDSLATRGDLQSRSIILRLPVIKDDQRKSEEEAWGSFLEDAPKILKALYEAASYGMKYPVQFKNKPRMADFSEWAAACLQFFGVDPDYFLHQFTENQKGSVQTILETDSAASLILELLDLERGSFEGTASELTGRLKDLAAHHGVQYKEIPSTKKVRDRLERLAPALRTVGVFWEDKPRDGKSRPLRIYKVNKEIKRSNPIREKDANAQLGDEASSMNNGLPGTADSEAPF